MKDIIKERLTSQQVLDYYNIPKQRANYICPFHKDKHASLSVKGNIFNCFACGTKGDVIEFVKKYFNLNFFEAMNKLNYDFNLGIQTNKQYTEFEKLQFAIYKTSKEIEKLEEQRSYKYWEEILLNKPNHKSKEIEKQIIYLENKLARIKLKLFTFENEIENILEKQKLRVGY